MKIRIAWNKGILRTPEQKFYQSQLMKSKYASGQLVSSRKNKPLSDEIKQKIRATSLTQHRTYSPESLAKRNLTLLAKKKAGWIHPRKGKKANISTEHKEKLRQLAKIHNLNQTILKIKRITEHLSQFNIDFVTVSDDQYEYTLHCKNCDTTFTRTETVLVPFRYELYKGQYCPTCYTIWENDWLQDSF